MNSGTRVWLGSGLLPRIKDVDAQEFEVLDVSGCETEIVRYRGRSDERITMGHLVSISQGTRQ